MRHVSVSCCAIFLVGCAGGNVATTPRSADRLAALVGTEHPPRPSGVTEVGSALLDDTERGRWVLAEIRSDDGTARAVVLEQVITPGSRGAARWRTLALQSIASDNAALTLQLASCGRGKAVDRSIVALTSGTTALKVRQAWRADTTARQFRSIDASTVTCESADGM